MSLQATTFALLAAQPALVAAVPTERWYRRGAQIDRSLAPYVVLAWEGSLVTGGRGTPEQLNVYVHDSLGSYKRIGDILRLVHPVLANTTHYRGPAGNLPFSFVCADFLGNSAESVDQGNGTSYQFSSWKILGGQP